MKKLLILLFAIAFTSCQEQPEGPMDDLTGIWNLKRVEDGRNTYYEGFSESGILTTGRLEINSTRIIFDVGVEDTTKPDTWYIIVNEHAHGTYEQDYKELIVHRDYDEGTKRLTYRYRSSSGELLIISGFWYTYWYLPEASQKTITGPN